MDTRSTTVWVSCGAPDLLLPHKAYRNTMYLEWIKCPYSTAPVTLKYLNN